MYFLKYVHDFIVLCEILEISNVSILILQGCFTGTSVIVLLPNCYHDFWNVHSVKFIIDFRWCNFIEKIADVEYVYIYSVHFLCIYNIYDLPGQWSAIYYSQHGYRGPLFISAWVISLPHSLNCPSYLHRVHITNQQNLQGYVSGFRTGCPCSNWDRVLTTYYQNI